MRPADGAPSPAEPPSEAAAPDGERGDDRAKRRQAWRELALARRLNRRAIKRARIESLILVPLIVLVLVAYSHRGELFPRDWDSLVRVITAVALMALGWQGARDIGRALAPTLFKRLDAGVAGTVGFLIRLVTLLTVTIVALRIADLSPRTLAFSGAVTAVLVGLAAQQTLGNIFAGTVLLSARTVRVGDRVRLQGGNLAGTVEGVVSSLGLLHTTLASRGDSILVPNSTVLTSAVVPLREPAAVEMRARLRPGVTPTDLEDILRDGIKTPTLDAPRITLEEVDGDEVVVRISVTPAEPSAGPRLAGEVLSAVEPRAARPAATRQARDVASP